MQTSALAIAAAAAMASSAWLISPVSATPIGGLAAARAAATDVGSTQNVAFYWAHHRYCWYDGGWHGPGWYWCGYSAREGLGWGGPEGWHGWRYGHRGGFHERFGERDEHMGRSSREFRGHMSRSRETERFGSSGGESREHMGSRSGQTGGMSQHGTNGHGRPTGTGMGQGGNGTSQMGTGSGTGASGSGGPGGHAGQPSGAGRTGAGSQQNQ